MTYQRRRIRQLIGKERIKGLLGDPANNRVIHADNARFYVREQRWFCAPGAAARSAGELGA